MARNGRHEETRGPALPWVIAGALGLLYCQAWLLGVGVGPQAPHDVPQPLVFVLVFAQKLAWPALLALAIFLSGASVGAALLKLTGCEPEDAFERILFATAIGLGVWAHVTLALGTLGMLGRNLFWGVTALMLVAGYLPLKQALDRAWRAAVAAMSRWGRFERALAAACLALLLVALLCTSMPVLDYDTLEYHLGAPAEYLRDGRVHFLPHNLYASFPQQVEMLYLVGMVLAGSKLTGMGVAVAIQVLFGALTAAAVAALAGRCVRRGAALPAAAFLLSCPFFILTVFRAGVEMAQAFYTAAALLAVFGWIWGSDRHPRARRLQLMLAGVCCGLAVAVKYPALLLVCLPVGVTVLAVSAWRGRGWWGKLAPALTLTACALAAALPWFVRNAAATGNPVFPLLCGVFGGGGWSAAQAAKFAQAHSPPSLAPGEILMDVWRFLAGYREAAGRLKAFTGPLAVLFIPLLLVPLYPGGRRGELRLRAGPVALLLGYWVAFVLLWAVATHRIARFLAPSLVALCALSAVGFALAARSRTASRICRAAALAGVVFAIYGHAALAYSNGGIGTVLGGDDLAAVTARLGARDYAPAVQWINDPRNVPPDATVMLVGEAQGFYFDRRLLYAVVFNDHPIEPALEAARRSVPEGVRELRESVATHVLVNWRELRRLSESYSYSFEGRRRRGYLPQVDAESGEPLRSLLNAAGRRVAHYGRMRRPGEGAPGAAPVVEIYDLRPSTAPGQSGDRDPTGPPGAGGRR